MATKGLLPAWLAPRERSIGTGPAEDGHRHTPNLVGEHSAAILDKLAQRRDACEATQYQQTCDAVFNYVVLPGLPGCRRAAAIRGAVIRR
jgi:hypothetical protein